MVSKEAYHNAAAIAAANAAVFHANLQDLPSDILQRLYQGGIRPGEPARSAAGAEQMLHEIPPAHRAGADPNSAAANVREYLADKHASHIQPYSQGGSSDPSNLKWESAQDNMARGGEPMTWQEQFQLDAQWHFDHLSGAFKAGLDAAPKGALVAASVTLPLALLRNGLRVVRKEITPSEAIQATIAEIIVNGAVGAATAFMVTTVATACAPIGAALAAVSPALLAIGGVGIVYQFFTLLDEHKQKVENYYDSLNEHELRQLEAIAEALDRQYAEDLRQHAKNMEFLAEVEKASDYIVNRPCEPGARGALKHYFESVAIARSLGATSQEQDLLLDR